MEPNIRIHNIHSLDFDDSIIIDFEFENIADCGTETANLVDQQNNDCADCNCDCGDCTF